MSFFRLFTLINILGASFGYTVVPLLSQTSRTPTATRWGYVRPSSPTPTTIGARLQMSSYSMDGSEYSSKDSDYTDDDDGMKSDFGKYRENPDEDETPTVELQPVPMSKNAGNRFVAFLWDRMYNDNDADVMDMHEERIALTEDHVMFCRKANLYDDAFNADSMVDVLWSRQMLSSDLKRTVGHAFCMESTALEHIHDLMKREPIIKMLTSGDLTNIPLYRWRHIRDYSLRWDDGRFGCPAMLVAMDDEPEEVGNLRAEIWKKQLETLIRSERIIAAGPLHLPTLFKDDEASALAVGDLIFFNAKDREAAIDFVESLPFAQEGLYKSMKVHFYNSLDTTGKFVSEDPLRDSPCEQMKEAMKHWGYPVEDEQTPWLNW